MRLLIIMMSALTVKGFAQDNKQGTIKVKKEKVYDYVEQMPVFQGGDSQLFMFIQTNLRYPLTAMENGVWGTIYATLTIGQDGRVKNARILKGISECPECEMEVLRVVNLMPPFTPGKKEGTPVSVQFNLPIRFRLN